MDTSRLLLALAIGTCFLLDHLDAKNCWIRPYCSCNNDERMTIYCRNVRNISDVLPLFRNHTPLYRIRLHGWFHTMPSRAFEGISVSILALMSPLEFELPEDSLLGIQNLQVVLLNRTLFEKIPKVFSNQDYQEFQSIRGSLTALDTELQSMSSVKKIDLSDNTISSVSKDAFLNSPGVQTLYLSYNKIEYLHPETFQDLKLLDHIDLSNNQLSTVDGCFQTLNPTIINLFNNQLTSIDNAFQKNILKLTNLNLGGNPNLRVTSASFGSNLKTLTELHLSGNNLSKLDPPLFGNLRNLHYLYLNHNNLTVLPMFLLQHTPFLTTLELSNNQLQTMEGVLDNRKEWYNVLKLTLDGNKLTTAALASKPVRINKLDMNRNHIDGIRAKDMEALPEKMVFLNLSTNEISFIESESFRGFSKLGYLDLSHNPLASLNRSLQGCASMYRLEIRHSQLESLSAEEFLGSPKLKHVDLHNNSLSTVHGAFKNMKYIDRVDVSANNLTTLTADSFPPFQKISIRIKLLGMADNPWACDCRLSWLVPWISREGSRLLDEPICDSPPRLQGRNMSSLTSTDLTTWTEDCPKACDCVCRSEGENLFTKVICFRKGLKEMPQVLPHNVRSLDLRGNLIESFDGEEIVRLEHLEHLDMERNVIEKVRLAFPPKLLSLRLASNRLRTFPFDEWISNSSVKEISLSRNPWTCNCDTWSFRNWLVQQNHSIVDLPEIRCGEQESTRLRNKPIISLSRNDLCFSMVTTIVIAACCGLLAVFCLGCVCCRHSIAACLYSLGCESLKGSREPHDRPYDAFLLYDEADEELALGAIAKGLESEKYPYQLCIPTRDIPGPRTAQKINAYLPQCNKVIVILSRKFIENKECLHHLISAMSVAVGSSSKFIIFIRHDDLPVSELDPVMKNLFKSCRHVKWGQCFFWQKLIYQLGKKDSDMGKP